MITTHPRRLVAAALLFVIFFPWQAAAQSTAQKDTLHFLRTQIRHGFPTSGQVRDSSPQATYFSLWSQVSVFANVEAIYLENDYSHLETELNLGWALSRKKAWLKPAALTARGQTDYTDEETGSLGIQFNLTQLPPIKDFAKKTYLDIFFQFYPLKTDDHLGGEDIYAYYRIPVIGRKLYLRGFARFYLYDHRDDDSVVVNDLILNFKKWDVYLRHSNLVEPRGNGISAGIRYLFTFRT